mmetsp:Transcript_111556/g.356081  ORF Transcript_111556/g.356081 Transcript_111556/m.356081 type:complete len:731 (-) Transcript_111556:192-2384(-)
MGRRRQCRGGPLRAARGRGPAHAALLALLARRLLHERTALAATGAALPRHRLTPAARRSLSLSVPAVALPPPPAAPAVPAELAAADRARCVALGGIASALVSAAPAAAAVAVGCGEEPDVNSFALGMVAGIVGTVATLALIFGMFLRNLSSSDLDGSRLGASSGLVMPSFFFQGAADIFAEVRQDTQASVQRFRETGDFAEIYNGIALSEQGAMLSALEALRQRFPKSATRELVFGAARWAALSSKRLAAALYDFALIVQRAATPPAGHADILGEIWLLDEGRCTVSGRRPGEGGRRPWANPNADILLDQQDAALRRTTAALLQRPLFAHVAPEILARPTYLALVRLFDVFRPSESCAADIPADSLRCSDYTEAEASAVDCFLDEVIRTTVMRRAYRHLVEEVGAEFPGTWKEALWQVWFKRWRAGPSVFEHVFLGNLAEDAAGQPIAGGLHCWLKFYLEELRGHAKYLGYIYNDPEAGVSDSHFVSGKFVWDHAGYRLVKDQGGFFVGVSPEWQLACGTVAYFETVTPERARKHGWQTLPSARTEGYTKDAAHDGYRYRHVVCIAPKSQDSSLPELRTSYASFLGRAVPEDAEASERDRICEPAELADRLPTWLVAEGFTLRESSELTRECADFCAGRGCRSLREAFKELKQVFGFILEDAVEAATTPGYPGASQVVEDTRECVEPLLEAARSGPLSAALPGLGDSAAGGLGCIGRCDCCSRAAPMGRP